MNTDRRLGDFWCQSPQSTNYGNRSKTPITRAPVRDEHVVRVLATAIVSASVSAALWAGSRWNLLFILSMYMGVLSLFGSHLGIRSAWLAPVL